jgi:hypothetical protein
MARQFLPILLAASFVALPMPALAAFYGGVDLGADSIDMKTSAPNIYPEDVIGPGVHLGYDFGKIWAVELGYATTRKSENQNDLRFNRLTGDALLYAPIGGFLSFLVTAGLSETNFGDSTYSDKGYKEDGIAKTTRVSTTLLNGDELNWRAGTGLSFALGDGYEFHVIGRYEPLSMKGYANYALSVSTGFNIAF